MRSGESLSTRAGAVLALFDDEERSDLLEATGLSIEAVGEQLDAAWLLRWILRQRTPFVQMAREIIELLRTIEARIRGNIDFLVLPEDGPDLALDFGPQMRKLIATATDWTRLAADADFLPALQALAETLEALCRNLRPQSIRRYHGSAETFRDLAEMTPDPAESMRYEMAAESMAADEDEYSPDDQRRLWRVNERLAALAHRAAEGGALAEDSEASQLLWRVRQMTGQKLQEVTHSQSTDYPFARSRLSKPQEAAILAELAAIERMIAAASELREAEGALFDFLALSFWKERWRIYELWLFCHVCRSIAGPGAELDPGERLQDGRWTLKYTSDKDPVLACTAGDETLDVFYQYLVPGAERANMPDVAVRVRSTGRWALVLDPKSGKTYRPKVLAEVCERYAEAFAPELSCVANYFPESPSTTVLPHPTRCVIYTRLRPADVGALDDEMHAALRRAGVTIVRGSVLALLDVSTSTADMCERLLAALRAELAEWRGAAAVATFSDSVSESMTAADFLASPPPTAVGGTGYGEAIEAGLARLAALPGERELWLFSDGDGDFDWAAAGQRLAERGIRLSAFIAAARPNAEIEAACRASGGRYENA